MADDPADWPHGARSTYINKRCRCLSCRAANTRYVTRMRQERQLPPGDPRHGTPNGYCNWGCRCLACCQAWIPVNARGWQQRKARQEAKRG